MHDFILFGILFDHFHFYPLVALKCYPHLIMCHMSVARDLSGVSEDATHNYLQMSYSRDLTDVTLVSEDEIR